MSTLSEMHVIDFPGFEHTEWLNKRALRAEVASLSAGNDRAFKTVALYTGGFPSWVLDPRRSVCADPMANVYRCLGSPKTRFALTALADIGRAVVQLAVLVLGGNSSVPGEVRVCGQNVSVEDIRDAVARVRGAARGPIEVGDLAAVKQRLKENQPPTMMDIVDYAR